MQNASVFLERWSRSIHAYAPVGVVAMLIAGCGGGGDASAPAQTRQVVEQMAGPFRVTASIPKRSYRKGEAIEVTFAVTNTSSERVVPYGSWGRNFGELNFGGSLGQFSVRRGDALVYESLLERGELSGVQMGDGQTSTQTLEWKQSDISAYLPYQSTYRTQVTASKDVANSASGNYQIVPRLAAPYYLDVQEFPQPDGTVAYLSGESHVLGDSKDVTLPPLSVTIEP